MDRIFLLSEVHPRTSENLHRIDPVYQAQNWFGFFPETDDAHVELRDLEFREKIARIHEEVRRRDGTLVLRDWTHLDFTGFPHVRDPAGRLLTAEELGAEFDVLNVSVVRHPMRQFRSHRRLMVDNAPEAAAFVDKWFTPEFYAQVYLAFARTAMNTGYVRYEDFLDDADDALGQICDMLDIEFDPSYADRWHAYEKMTGDMNGPTDRIRQPGAGAPDPLDERLRSRDEYAAACALLEYEA